MRDSYPKPPRQAIQIEVDGELYRQFRWVCEKMDKPDLQGFEEAMAYWTWMMHEVIKG